MPDYIDRPNRIKGTCFQCGTRVEANAGRLAKQGAQWLVCCTRDFAARPGAQAAATQPSSNAPDIGGDLGADGQVIWKLQRQLGDRFQAYLATKRTIGLRAKQDAKGQWFDYCPVPQAGNVHQAFEKAGFKVVVSAKVAAAMQGALQQQRATEAATQTRLEHPKASGLFPFQRAGVQWLAQRANAVLGDEMGCGKTVQTLMAMPDRAPVILVVPSAVKLNWQREAAKWRPEYKTTVLSGRGSFRWPAPGEMVIVNYDILPKAPEWKGYGDMPALTGAWAGAPERIVLVADEAHMLKNYEAQRTKNFRLLKAIANNGGGNCWLLTGTPILNRPIELWGVFSSAGVAQEAFGSFDRFKRLFNARDGRYGIEWGDPEPEVPELMRRVQLRREKKDVLSDLPAKTRKRVYIAIEDVELKAADKKKLDKAAESIPVVPEEAVANLPELPSFEQFSSAMALLGAVKVQPTVEYLQQFIEEGVPVLVFGTHIEPLRLVQQAMEKQGKKWGLFLGDTGPEERQQIVDGFQQGRLDGICISVRAGGVGITLTRANHSVFMEMDVVPGLNVQAEDRIHRIGQTVPVTIHQMVLEHPLDKRVQDILSRKMELLAQTVEASTVLPTDALAMSENASALEAAVGSLVISELQAGTKARDVEGPVVQTVKYHDGKKDKVVVVPLQARPARTARELWAADGLVSLREMDEDRAALKNEMGFSISTGPMGHAMAALIQAGHGLTDVQWQAAIEICRIHKGQVGAPPQDKPLAPVQGVDPSLLTRVPRKDRGMLSGVFNRWKA